MYTIKHWGYDFLKEVQMKRSYIDSETIIVGDFNVPISSLEDIQTRTEQRSFRDKLHLRSNIYLRATYIYIIIYPSEPKYRTLHTFFSVCHATFSKTYKSYSKSQ